MEEPPSSSTPRPPTPLEVDVLIVGAGPVGLTLAYQLSRFSQKQPYDQSCTSIPPRQPSSRPISIHLIEAHPKPVQESFGRAVTFWSRSMEMLDQLDLAADLLQQCVAVRHSAAYDQSGTEVFGRGWSFVEGISDTRYRFASVLRQKFVEDIFRQRLRAEFGVNVTEQAKFVGLEVDQGIEEGGMGRVTAKIVDSSGSEPREYVVKCRYLIGCDGSRTAVRGAAGIESDGDRTEDKWVRIDGVLTSTTMPKPRCYGAIESPIYGNVLWIPLDHGATRIGFALNEDRRKRYPELNTEAFVNEAKLAVAPFEIEYEKVDWASVYTVGQRVARNFWTKGCIFLAGDACHTHSSGAGQGMNAGMHDAVNLGWKLALVLMGLAKKEVLSTYELERRPNAQRLIKYDEDISVLVTGRLPKSWKGDPTEDPNIVLGQILQEAKGFNTGLTIGYEENLAVWKNESAANGLSAADKAIIPAPAIPGYRAPDVKLVTPALWEPVWLHQLTRNLATFYIVIFVGKSVQARESFVRLKNMVLSRKATVAASTTNGLLPGANSVHSNGLDRYYRDEPVEYLTLLPQTVANAWHELGTDPIGRVYYDGDGSANQRYGVDIDLGAVFILRPDGWIGARLDLNAPDVGNSIEKYLGGLLLR